MENETLLRRKQTLFH